MSVIGYKRVSTVDQNLDRQDLGDVDKVFEEKLSGKSASDRPALQDLIGYARDGDTVVVHIIQTLNDKGVAISFLSERLTFSADADDAFAKLQLQMMGAFAEFERNIIRKRQAEGIAAAKAKGVYKGGKKRIDRDKVHQLKAEGLSTYKIADAMGVSRMSVHRILNTESA